MDFGDERATELIAWLTEQGLRGDRRQDLLTGFCEKLAGFGVPLLRFHLAQRAFHPKFGGIGFNWTRNDGLSHEHYEYSETPRDAWLKSPFFFMLEERIEELRMPLGSPEAEQFPLLQDLLAMGGTEYFVLTLSFTTGEISTDPKNLSEGVMASWTTDRPGGFLAEDIALLKAVYPFLGMVLKSMSNRQMASDLLQVYLGRDAGLRVLSGEIQRGSLREVDAVICLFDLQGFTHLVDELPGPELIAMLNDYFGLAVATIQAHGGNILKFLGDGMLTMFNLGDIGKDAHAALDAVSELGSKICEHNVQRAAQGLPTTGFTLALHAGDILYGNIGAENRLDFTVIGTAVNQTARIASMHRSVGQSVILSEDVKKAAEGTGHDLVSLGRYMLRSIPEPMELFTIYQSNGCSDCNTAPGLR